MLIPGVRSLRVLGKHWKLTAIAVFSLAIAMALGVVALSVSNTMVFLSPAAPQPDRLVSIHGHSAQEAIDQISFPDYLYYRRNNHVFTDIAAAPNSISILGDWKYAKREYTLVARPVSENYFAVLGIRPFLGRLFESGDDQGAHQGNGKIAVMTYGCWKRLGSDPNIVGKVLAGLTIVGVTPKDFTGAFYGVNGDLMLPLSNDNDASSLTRRDVRRFLLLGRLKPGVSRQQAQAEMLALSGQLATEYPKDDKGRSAIVTRASLLPPDLVPTAELIAGVLVALVLMVLVIACANVANLLLAIAVGRRQEAAIKMALGASRRRLIREFLTESAVICAAGGTLGYFAASALIARYSVITLSLPTLGEFSISLNLHLDATVFAFTLALMFVAIVSTGLAPARYASSPDIAQVITGETAVGGTRKAVRRNALVIAQVAVCTLVLVGMGLCQRNLYNLRHADPGFSARNLLAVQILGDEGRSEAYGRAVYARLREAVATIPGVESISLVENLPLLGAQGIPVQIPGGKEPIQAHQTDVDSDYFSTFGIPILEGRGFDSRDRKDTPEVAVINRKMAEMIFPGTSAVGKTITIDEPPRRVIVSGVAANGKYLDLDEPEMPFVYTAFSQHYQGSMNIVATTKGDPKLWIALLARAMRDNGQNLLAEPQTFNDWVDLLLFMQRLSAACVGALSALGLLLAILGLFGAISYSVSERKKELGIRIALGAGRRQLMTMVLRQTFVVVGTGISIGLASGVVATTLLRSQFYRVGTVEWTVLIPVAAGMLFASLVVAYFSARPWITVDPMEAVRHA